MQHVANYPPRSLSPIRGEPPKQLGGAHEQRESALMATVAELRGESLQLKEQWKSDITRLERELESMRDAAASASSASPPVTAQMEMEMFHELEKLDQTSAAEVELLRELEKLEVALAQERQRTATLMEEKEAMQVAHSRDVATLEAMLQQVMGENTKLAAEVATMRGRHATPDLERSPTFGALRANTPQDSTTSQNTPRSIERSTRSTRSYLEQEPEIERTGQLSLDLSRSFRSVSSSGSAQRAPRPLGNGYWA